MDEYTDNAARGLETIFRHGTDQALFDNTIGLPSRMYTLSVSIYCATGMSSWCFNRKGELYNNTFPSYHDFLLFFRLGGCLDYALEQAGKVRMPMLLTDPLDLVWIAEWAYDGDDAYMLFVYGPVFSTSSSVKNVEESLRRLEVSVKLRKSLVEKLEIVPVLSQPNIIQYAKMLHYNMTGMSADIGGIHYQPSKSAIMSRDDDMSELPDPNPEQSRALEKVALKMVREGNVFGLGSADKLSHYAAYVTGDSKRDGKDSLIVLAALCARAAMDGGLSPKVAKQVEAHYIRIIEKSVQLTELLPLRSMILEDFTTRVRATRETPEISPAVRECCTYINTHLRDSLELSDVARAVGYTEYYLTKKFHKETGVRLADYIKSARIEQAKIMLMSNITVQAISDELQFSSRSFFTKVFKSVVGMSPAEYRTANGKEANEE